MWLPIERKSRNYNSVYSGSFSVDASYRDTISVKLYNKYLNLNAAENSHKMLTEWQNKKHTVQLTTFETWRADCYNVIDIVTYFTTLSM